MTRGDIKAGRAFVELAVNSTGLQAGLKEAQRSLVRYVSAAALIGGATAAVKQFASQGAALQDLSDRTGVAASTLSSLGHAAQMSGVEIESLQPTLVKMQKTIVEAGQGSKGAIDALARIGLEASKLESLTPDQRFIEIAQALTSITDPGERAVAAMDIFGKSAANLIPLLDQGKAGIEAFRAEAERLGVVWTDEMAAKAAELDDKLLALNKQWEMMVANVGFLVADSGLLEFLSAASERLADMQTRAKGFGDALGTWMVGDGQREKPLRDNRAFREFSNRIGVNIQNRRRPDGGMVGTDEEIAARRKAFEERKKQLDAEFQAQQKAEQAAKEAQAEQSDWLNRGADAGDMRAGREAMQPPGLSWLERGARAGGVGGAPMFSDEAAAAAGRLAELESMRPRLTPGGTAGTFSASAAVAMGGQGTMQEVLAQARTVIKKLEEFNARQKQIEQAIRESAPQFTE